MKWNVDAIYFVITAWNVIHLCDCIHIALRLISLFLRIRARFFSYPLSCIYALHFLWDSLNPEIYILFIPVCKYKCMLSVFYDR